MPTDKSGTVAIHGASVSSSVSTTGVGCGCGADPRRFGGVARARTQGAVALDLDDPQRQSPAPEPRRAEGRRPPGVERLGRDPDDRALFRCAAAAGPGRGQAACRPVFHAIQYLLGPPEPREARAVPRRSAARNPTRRAPRTATIVDFSTGSVGLGVGMTLFASLVQDYLRLQAAGVRSAARRPHDRAAGRRRARRGQHLRGAARRLEARRPQPLVDHRLQPPEPRRVVSDRLFGRIDACSSDGLARRDAEIRAPAAGGLRPARRRGACATGSTPARTRSIRRWSTRAARAGASICSRDLGRRRASARSSTSMTMRALARADDQSRRARPGHGARCLPRRRRRRADLLHRLHDQGLRAALRRPQGQPRRADEPRPDGGVPAADEGAGGRGVGPLRRPRPAGRRARSRSSRAVPFAAGAQPALPDAADRRAGPAGAPAPSARLSTQEAFGRILGDLARERERLRPTAS